MLLHEAERRHTEHQQEHEQRQRHHQSAQHVRSQRASEPAAHRRPRIHRHMTAGQNTRENGKLCTHRLQPLVNPRAFRKHTDVHNHHEQRQRQHALAHKQRERTRHRARREQPLNTRDIRHIRHHGQGVERHGPLLQRLPQREHSNNSRHENHREPSRTTPYLCCRPSRSLSAASRRCP